MGIQCRVLATSTILHLALLLGLPFYSWLQVSDHGALENSKSRSLRSEICPAIPYCNPQHSDTYSQTKANGSFQLLLKRTKNACFLSMCIQPLTFKLEHQLKHCQMHSFLRFVRPPKHYHQYYLLFCAVPKKAKGVSQDIHSQRHW